MNLFGRKRSIVIFMVTLIFLLIASFFAHDFIEHSHPGHSFKSTTQTTQTTLFHGPDKNSLALLAFIISLVFAVFGFLNTCLIEFNSLFRREKEYFHNPKPIVFDKLKLAYSRGIIEPKIYF